MDKKQLNDFVGVCYELLGSETYRRGGRRDQAPGLHLCHRLGHDHRRQRHHGAAEQSRQCWMRLRRAVEETERQYRRGLITEEEQYNKVVELWTRATDDITQAVQEPAGPADGPGRDGDLGATKGGIQPIRQLAGMRGLMADPSGRIIALPIRSNFREGLTALEYFLSTHGARKGLADTALRTADAGYLTRRLVDVAQDVIITEDDCGTQAGIWLTKQGRDGDGREAAPSASSAAWPPRRLLDPEDRRGAGRAQPDDRRAGCAACRARRRGQGLRALAADLRNALRPLPAVLRQRPGPRRHGQDGRGGRHHRRPVHRRARHAADPAHLPHRWCGRRRRHHPGPAARRGAVRGAHAQGRGRHRRDRRRGGRLLGRRRAQAEGDELPAAPQDAPRSRRATRCWWQSEDRVQANYADRRAR